MTDKIAATAPPRGDMGLRRRRLVHFYHPGWCSDRRGREHRTKGTTLTGAGGIGRLQDDTHRDLEDEGLLAAGAAEHGDARAAHLPRHGLGRQRGEARRRLGACLGAGPQLRQRMSGGCKPVMCRVQVRGRDPKMTARMICEAPGTRLPYVQPELRRPRRALPACRQKLSWKARWCANHRWP